MCRDYKVSCMHLHQFTSSDHDRLELDDTGCNLIHHPSNQFHPGLVTPVDDDGCMLSPVEMNMCLLWTFP